MIPFLLQTVSIPFLRLFFGFFADFEVFGLENLKDIKNKGVIFASNHVSELDPIIVTIVVPFFSKLRPMYYVSREKSFYNPTFMKKIFYGGFFFKLWGAYPAFPGKHDYAFALSHHLIFLRKNRSVCIFPEGKINKDGTFQEPKGGVGYLAEFTNAVIIPAHIKGTEKATLRNLFLRKVKISVTFGKPIFSNELEKGEYKKNAKMIMDKVYKL